MARKSKLLIDPRQAAFTEAYLSPQSPTYANAYQSALIAGYAEEYAKTITAQQPQWLSETISRLIPTEEEVIAGIKRETDYGLGINEKNSAMAAQTRLKAWELLGKTRRIKAFDTSSTNTFNGDIHISLGLPKPKDREVIEL